MSDLVGNPEDGFSGVAAQITVYFYTLINVLRMRLLFKIIQLRCKNFNIPNLGRCYCITNLAMTILRKSIRTR